MNVKTATASVVLLLALAGCSPSPQPLGAIPSATAAPSTTTPAPPTIIEENVEAIEPGNPVDIARKIKGCKLDASADVGEHDAMGGRFVHCEWLNNGGGTTGGTIATVRTYDHDPVVGETDELRPDDTTDVILGAGFSVVIVGATMYGTHIDTHAVAEQVGGKLVRL